MSDLYEYENKTDLLEFILDVSKVNMEADYNDDKVWREEFKFLANIITKFLNKDKPNNQIHPVMRECLNSFLKGGK